jgi:hypothetical protein
MELVAASSIVSIIAVTVWLIQAPRKTPQAARIRYRVTRALLVYGVASIPLIVVYLFVGLELGVVTWGGPDNFWLVAAMFSSVLAISTSAILGTANLVLKRNLEVSPSHEGNR